MRPCTVLDNDFSSTWPGWYVSAPRAVCRPRIVMEHYLGWFGSMLRTPCYSDRRYLHATRSVVHCVLRMPSVMRADASRGTPHLRLGHPRPLPPVPLGGARLDACHWVWMLRTYRLLMLLVRMEFARWMLSSLYETRGLCTFSCSLCPQGVLDLCTLECF